MLLICVVFGIFACINPVIEISVVAPSNADSVLYGTASDKLDFQLRSHHILGGWKNVDADKAEISGYTSSQLGKQTISVVYKDKTATFQVNVVPVDLSIPQIQIQDGSIRIEYDSNYTENLVIEINGTEYKINPTKTYTLPQSFDAGVYTVRVKAVNKNNCINDSNFSKSLTIKKLQPVQLKEISNSKLLFEASSESDSYDIYVDEAFYTTINTNEFDLNRIQKSGSHSISVVVKAQDGVSVSSNQSEVLSYTMLSNSIKFFVDSGYLTWSPAANAAGYELYASGKLVSSYGADVPMLDIMSFYSETGSEKFSIKVLGDGNKYVDSSLSATYTHTFTEKYIPLKTINDLYKLNNSDEDFILVNDIDLSSVTNWTPIDNFSGYLYGNNKAIKNLTINSSNSNVGFFSTLSGQITNLTIENANITISGSYENIGILCGTLSSIVNNCAVSGAISAPESSNVGGLAGYVNRRGSYTMSNLTNKANISGKDYVGGIFGKILDEVSSSDGITATFTSLTNIGAITASGNYVGGIFGYGKWIDTYTGSDDIAYVKIETIKNTGNISGKQYVGGLFGYVFAEKETSYLFDYTSDSTIIGTADFDNIAGKLENITIK